LEGANGFMPELMKERVDQNLRKQPLEEEKSRVRVKRTTKRSVREGLKTNNTDHG